MDAMKMLEASTESSKREMEILDALQDIRCVPFPLRSIFARCFCMTSISDAPTSLFASVLDRTRNARMERAGGSLTTTPAHLLAGATAEDLRRLREAEEDEDLVRAVFSKIPDPSRPSSSDPKGKGKGRALPGPDDDDAGEGEAADDDAKATAVEEPVKSMTVKRKLDATGDEPSLAALLSQKGLSTASQPKVGGSGAGGGFGFGAAASAAKKKKVGGGGIPGLKGIVKKKSVLK